MQSCLSVRRIVKWMCWRSNVFASISARNLVRRPQKRTKCCNRHPEKQRWVGPRHLGHWESEASPVKCQDNADRFLLRGGSGASRVSSPTPDHESGCLHNRSATPSRCSSSETASLMVFRYLASAPRQCTMPRGPECQGILGQEQHPRDSPPALITRFGPLRLLPLPQAEEHSEGEKISRRRGDTAKHDTAVAGHSYQTCIEKWKDRWNRCIQSGGSYFEGDNFE
jgi:hypothetical protein